MNAPDVLALIERLERDLAALKRAVQPVDAADDDVRQRVEERAAQWRKRGAR